MLNFTLLMLVPLLISVGSLIFFKKKVTVWEFLGQIGVAAVFVGVCLVISYNARTTDTEIWNGQVTQRETHHVSCSHSYSCNCRQECSGSGKNRSCTTVCDTCYEHSYDVDWSVHSSTGEIINIDREDRQGLVEPKRWDAVYPGEPFSSSHSYTNYILANPDSVLLGSKGDVEKYKALLPPYPDGIYDYYKHDPVVNLGVPSVDTKTWEWLVREANKTLGTEKQVNLVVLLVPTPNLDYMQALKEKWVGGKKNDVVVVIGSIDGHKIEWADIMSWTPNGEFKVSLKNQIEDIGTLDRKDDIIKAIRETTSAKFERMHMKDFKYLMRSFQPSTTAMWITFILSSLLSFGLALWSILNDITDDESENQRRNRYSY